MENQFTQDTPLTELEQMRMKLSDIKEFIDLASCCQKATVITDFSDLEKIGWDHFRNVIDGDMRSEEYKLWDGRETALALIESCRGRIPPTASARHRG